jgi:acyl-CoA synthetase (AMP-forming)/AMP-acid ligase II
VEDVIEHLDLIKEVAIIGKLTKSIPYNYAWFPGVPHSDFGEAVVAVCIPKEKSSAEGLEEKLKAEVKSRLANYKRPKKYIFVEDYPRNFIGKIQKNKLRDQFKGLFSGN